MEIVSHPTSPQEILKKDNNDKASGGKKNNTIRGRGGRNECGGDGGKRDRRDLHPPLLWSKAVMYDAYSVYNTLDLCFPDTKTNKSKMTTTIMINNVNCDHDTVREGVKLWMESVRSAAASASASASSSLASYHFLVKILGHILVLQSLLSSSRNHDEIIIATSIPIFSLPSISQSLLSFQKRCRYNQNYTRPILRNTIVFGSGDGMEG